MKTMTDKITNEQIEQWEIDSLVDAVFSGSIELDDEFLERCCSQFMQDQLKQIPESDRTFVLDGVDYKAHFNGSSAGCNEDDIWLDVCEIEFQFEGEPEEVFETPDDLTIDGNLAYLYVGYGLTIDFDHEQVKQAVKWYLEV